MGINDDNMRWWDNRAEYRRHCRKALADLRTHNITHTAYEPLDLAWWGMALDYNRYPEFEKRIGEDNMTNTTIRNFTILYDNGKKFTVNKPQLNNVRTVGGGDKLTYLTDHKTNSLNVVKSTCVSMADVAAIEIHCFNGDIILRRFKPCAQFNVEVTKRK